MSNEAESFDLGEPTRVQVILGGTSKTLDPIEINDNVLVPTARDFPEDTVGRINAVKLKLAEIFGVSADLIAADQVMRFAGFITKKVGEIQADLKKNGLWQSGDELTPRTSIASSLPPIPASLATSVNGAKS